MDAAIDKWREVIRLKPNDLGAHYNLGVALCKKRNWNDAIVAFRKAIRIRPDDWRFHNDLGATLDIQGDTDDAIVACREAIRLKPDEAGPHDNLGIALAHKKDWAGAIAEHREAIRLRPDDASNAYYNLACTFALKDQPDESGKALATAIELAPGCRQRARNDKDFDRVRSHAGIVTLIGPPDEDSGAATAPKPPGNPASPEPQQSPS